MVRHLIIVVLAAAALGLPSGSARGDDSAAVSLEPASGSTDSGDVALVTSRRCAEPATNVVVQIAGAGFPEGSNAVGNSELSMLRAAVDGPGFVIPLFGSWDVVAQSNGSQGALDGGAHMRLLCIDPLGTQIFDEMTGDVRFFRQDGSASRYEQNGGPALTSGLTPAPPDDEGYVYVTAATEDATGDLVTQGPTEIAEAGAELVEAGELADQIATEEAPAPTDDGAAADGAADALAATDAVAVGQDTTDVASELVTGRSSTALVVGALLFTGALAAAGATYTRARRGARPPS